MPQTRFALRNSAFITLAFAFIFAQAELFAQAPPARPAGPPAKPAAPAPKPAAPAAPPAPVAKPPAPAKPATPVAKPPAPAAPVTKPAAPSAEQSPVGERVSNEEIDETDPEAAEEGEGNKDSVWSLIRKGGLTMLGLGLITTIIIAFSLERWFFFVRQKMNTKGFFDSLNSALESGGMPEAEKLLKDDDRLIARIVSSAFPFQKEGMSRVEKAVESSATVEIGKLERGLNLLSNLGNLAPLLGFFGTVVGMRASFLQFVEQAAPTARDLAGGVEEALITTAAGLLIAIPTYLIYNLFIYAIDKFSIELERCTAAITARIKN